jgi:2-phosphoglycerate kinase
MTIALNTGILRCISTDIVRQVLRSIDPQKTQHALHRSSYSGTGDAITQWKECCEAVNASVTDLVDDSLKRGYSLVLEGVHILPTNALIERWKAAGGVATGLVLVIPDEKAHLDFIKKRGQQTGKGAEKQVNGFPRIRQIQGEMMRLAEINKWMVIEQRTVEPVDPIDVIDDVLNQQMQEI